MIQNSKRSEVEEEIRRMVDNQLREELDYLKMVRLERLILICLQQIFPWLFSKPKYPNSTIPKPNDVL